MAAARGTAEKRFAADAFRALAAAALLAALLALTPAPSRAHAAARAAAVAPVVSAASAALLAASLSPVPDAPGASKRRSFRVATGPVARLALPIPVDTRAVTPPGAAAARLSHAGPGRALATTPRAPPPLTPIL